MKYGIWILTAQGTGFTDPRVTILGEVPPNFPKIIKLFASNVVKIFLKFVV